MESNAHSKQDDGVVAVAQQSEAAELPSVHYSHHHGPLYKRAVLASLHKLRILPLFHPLTKNTATVFMIHRFASGDQAETGRITADTLDLFLTFLKKNGYTVISLEEWIDALRRHRSTRKTVVLTVDDGYRDIYTVAFPILKAHGVPATIFIATDFIDGNIYYWWDRIENALLTTSQLSVNLEKLGLGHVELPPLGHRRSIISRVNMALKQFGNEKREELVRQLVERLNVPLYQQPPKEYAPLTWSEIQEMAEHNIDFHSHTRTHPILTSLSYEDKCLELSESKRVLKERIGKNSEIFCYPNGEDGFFDDESVRALKETGFIAACTGIPGFDLTTDEVDLYRLHRLSMPTRLDIFEQYVCGFEQFKERMFR